MTTRMRIGPDVTRTFVPADGAAGVDWHLFPDRVGSVRWDADGKRAWRLVMVEDLALVAGDLVCFTTDNDYKHVSSDRDGVSENERAAGQAVVACALGSACWIQTTGLNSVAIVTSGNVVADSAVIASSATDGAGDISAGTSTKSPYDEFGQALADDTGTALAAGLLMLHCPTDG